MRNTSHVNSKKIKALLLVATLLLSPAFGGAGDWPEFRGTDRNAVWEADGLVENFEGMANPLPRVWSTPVGAGYSGPTVSGDSVYLMDRGAPGDATEVERIVCVDRTTGKPKWIHSYPCVYSDVGYAVGPRSSVTIRDGRAWALGMMGHLHCLDAASGQVIWAKDLAKDYKIDMPIWGLTASPLVEGGTLVAQISAGPDEACVVGLDPATGAEKWKLFSDKGSYVSPVVIDQAGKRVTIVWTGERIAGIDAATGTLYWEVPTKPNKMPINVPGPAFNADHTKMFLSVFYDGSRLIELDQTNPAAKELWHRQGINERKTDALHCMISPPFFRGEHIFGIDSYGQLRCLDPENGNRIWENLTALPQERWSTGFTAQNGENTWIVNERGEIMITRFTLEGFEEIDRAALIEPTTPLKQRREGTVMWSYPAFAGTQVFVRNDRQLICVELGK
ncbi:MAG: PQQ-binding-like beta-propeller repeat protein [Verrucomicrobiales bacterium]|nr:PQQ-binding-like beta-propeller repeat protein [Verrucomicrobiales bacterium]